MRAEGKAGEFGDLLGGSLRKFRMRVQPRSYGCTANGKIVKPFERLLQPVDVAFEQAGPAAEFLADGQGHGILQMRAANLDDAVEYVSLASNRVAHGLDGEDQRM